MRYLVPVGRVLYSLIFLMTILGHFSAGYIGYATQQVCRPPVCWSLSRA